MSVTLDTSHLETSPSNDAAARNIAAVVVTLDTSQFEMSPLNTALLENMRLMSVMLDTSQFAIGPFSLGWYGPSKQFPFGYCSRHSSTAALSFFLDCGENAGCWEGVQGVRGKNLGQKVQNDHIVMNRLCIAILVGFMRGRDWDMLSRTYQYKNNLAPC